MILEYPHAKNAIPIRSDDICTLALALDEFFDVLDVIYLERDGITPALPRNDRLRGFRRLDGINRAVD